MSFLSSSRDAIETDALIDASLIDAAVHEWMSGVGDESEAAREGYPGASCTNDETRQSGTAAGTRTSFPTGPDPKAAMRRVYKALRQTADVETPPAIAPSRRASGKMDRVLTAAIRQHLLTEEELKRLMQREQIAALPDWRTVRRWVPDRAHALERVAATLYGFRPVLICQMSTLVLIDLLTMRIPPQLWGTMIQNGVIPVVEHGSSPDPSYRVLCVSNDPTSREVKAVLGSILAFSPELAYADAHHIRSMVDLMNKHIPVIGAAKHELHPSLVSTESSASPVRAA